MRLEARVSVRASDANAFLTGLRKVGLQVEDTGERITTDEGLEGEFVFNVVVPVAHSSGDGSLILHRH